MSAFHTGPLDNRRIVGRHIFVFVLMLCILPDLIRVMFRLSPQAANGDLSATRLVKPRCGVWFASGLTLSNRPQTFSPFYPA